MAFFLDKVILQITKSLVRVCTDIVVYSTNLRFDDVGEAEDSTFCCTEMQYSDAVQ